MRARLAVPGFVIVAVVAYIAGVSGYDYDVLWMLMGAAVGGILVGAS